VLYVKKWRLTSRLIMSIILFLRVEIHNLTFWIIFYIKLSGADWWSACYGLVVRNSPQSFFKKIALIKLLFESFCKFFDWAKWLAYTWCRFPSMSMKIFTKWSSNWVKSCASHEFGKHSLMTQYSPRVTSEYDCTGIQVDPRIFIIIWD